MVQHPGLVYPRLRAHPSHSFPQTLHDLQVKLFIDCLTTWNKLMMNNTLPIKKKKLSTSPSHLSDSDVLFLVVARIFPPTATTALLFQHRSRTPTFHHLLWHFSESFHQYSNDLIAPDWLRGGSVFVPLSADAAQILRQHDAASVFRVKIVWHELLQMPTSSETSRIVRRRFLGITERTFSMWSSPVDEEARPDLGSSSMDVLPNLKRWYYS